MSKEKKPEDGKNLKQGKKSKPDEKKRENDKELSEKELSNVTGGAIHQLRKK